MRLLRSVLDWLRARYWLVASPPPPPPPKAPIESDMVLRVRVEGPSPEEVRRMAREVIAEQFAARPRQADKRSN